MQISKLEEFGVPKGVIDVLKNEGLEKLYPPQEEALLQGLLELKSSYIIAVPTASGKTLTAELLMTKSILEENGKCLYIVPLRALASEKYQEFMKYQTLGIKVGITTGEYDSSDSQLAGSDIIITTSEKADSLLRHKSDWLDSLSVVVADEIHLINDAKRGPTLEVTLARLRHLNPNIIVLGLSATIQNADEIAEWLDAKLILSDWRPVNLVEGVYCDSELQFNNSKILDVEAISKDIPINLAAEVVKNGGQSLVFVNTRRSAEKCAEDASKVIKKFLKEGEIGVLEKLSKEILDVLPEPTRICKRLSNCVKGGTAFHHAGLVTGQRKIIEEAYKKNLIKVISATPTLAAGVNLPARRVVIRDYHRYDPTEGRKEILVIEYKQMAGRAGRPKYDDYGEAILIAKTQNEKDHLMDDFIMAGPERIESKLAVETALRAHVLATIAAGYASSHNGLLEFFSKTFLAHQYGGDTLEWITNVDQMIEFLEAEKFIYEEGDRIIPTSFGRRTSELYIDPMTAVIMRDAIQTAQEIETNEISYLHAISRTLEIGTTYVRKKYGLFLANEFKKNMPFLLIESLDETYGYDQYAQVITEFKTALFLMYWIDEKSDEEILEKFNISPGDVRTKVDISDWLLYSMSEIGKLFKLKKLDAIQKLRVRIRNGVKEELLEIISLKDIGRVRARSLFDADFKSLENLKTAEVSDLSKVKGVGLKLAKNIKDQLA